MLSSLCKCGNLKRSPDQRYCRECHNAYMRDNRPKHRDLPDLAKKKATCRAYANTYQNRGHIVKQSCKLCGSDQAEKHHENYDKPLEIEWLCRDCHLEYHAV